MLILEKHWRVVGGIKCTKVLCCIQHNTLLHGPSSKAHKQFQEPSEGKIQSTNILAKERRKVLNYKD